MTRASYSVFFKLPSWFFHEVPHTSCYNSLSRTRSQTLWPTNVSWKYSILAEIQRGEGWILDGNYNLGHTPYQGFYPVLVIIIFYINNLLIPQNLILSLLILLMHIDIALLYIMPSSFLDKCTAPFLF